MSNFVQRLFGTKTPSNAVDRSRCKVRLEVEQLAERVMPSVSGTAFPVSGALSSYQYAYESANAHAANGRSVVVWTKQTDSFHPNTEIHAQVFDSTGARIGGEITVDHDSRNEYAPKVAMDDVGNWVVVWTLEASPTNKDVYGQLFFANGQIASNNPPFVVANSNRNEYEPSVAMSAKSFVVSYTDDYSPTDSQIEYRVFTINPTGPSLYISNSRNGGRASSVAMAPDGSFDITYTRHYSPTDNSVRLARFNSAGVFRDDLALEYIDRYDKNPGLAVDNFGNALVTYQTVAKFGGAYTFIYAQRVLNSDTDGSLRTPIFIAETLNTDTSLSTSVALDPTSASFVVAYSLTTGANQTAVFVREVSNTDDTSTPPINLGFVGSQPAVTVRSSHYYLVTYTNNNDTAIKGQWGFLPAPQGVLARFVGPVIVAKDVIIRTLAATPPDGISLDPALSSDLAVGPLGPGAPTAPPAGLGAVSNALSHSAEFYGNFITAAYQRYLGRTPTADEVNGWVGVMQQGFSDEQLEASFIGSAEYIQNHGGNGPAWVTGMYQDLLGRTPEQAEVDGWVLAMANGMSPTKVAYGFAASAEREGQRITADYQKYVGRTPDANEVANWVDAFTHGTSNENVIAGFVGSTEYFQGHDSNVQEWLWSAYTDILGREPDDAGNQAWMAFLNSSS